MVEDNRNIWYDSQGVASVGVDVNALKQRIAELEAGLHELAQWPASPYVKERAKDILEKG